MAEASRVEHHYWIIQRFGGLCWISSVCLSRSVLALQFTQGAKLYPLFQSCPLTSGSCHPVLSRCRACLNLGSLISFPVPQGQYWLTDTYIPQPCRKAPHCPAVVYKIPITSCYSSNLGVPTPRFSSLKSTGLAALHSFTQFPCNTLPPLQTVPLS